MSSFNESLFYKTLQDFFINNNKETFLQLLAEFYNRTDDIITEQNIQADLIKELRELYIEINEKGFDENVIKDKINLFLENKQITQKIESLVNDSENIISQLDTKANLINSTKTINVKEYGFDNTGTNDNTSLFNSILAKYSQYNSLKLYFEEGDYILNNAQSIDKNISLVGDNESDTSIISTLNNPSLVFRSKYTDVQSVSSLTVTDTTTEINIIDSSNYKKGDIIKLISDDIMVDGTTQGNNYGTALMGNYYIVSEVSTGKVILGNVIDITKYSTNIRIGKQGKHNLCIKGITFKDKGTKNSYLQKMVSVIGGQNHNIDCRFGYTEQTGISFRSCYNYYVNAKADFQVNDSDNGLLGYTVIDRGSENFKVRFNCGSVRHPYTCNTANPTSSLDGVVDFEKYGISSNYEIENSNSYGTCQASIDTHCFTRGLRVNNCHIDNNGLVGMVLRGISSNICNCEINSWIGFTIGSQDVSYAKHIISNSIITCEKECVMNGINNLEVIFKNCEFNINNFITANNGVKIKFENCTFNIIQPLKSTNTSMEFYNCIFNINKSIVLINTSTSPIKMFNCHVNLIGDNGEYNFRLISNSSGEVDIFIDGLTIFNERNSTPFSLINLGSLTYTNKSKITIKNFHYDNLDNRLKPAFNNSNEFTKWCYGVNKTDSKYTEINFQYI